MKHPVNNRFDKVKIESSDTKKLYFEIMVVNEINDEMCEFLFFWKVRRRKKLFLWIELSFESLNVDSLGFTNIFHPFFSAKLIHKSKRKRRRTGDNNEEPVESDGALEGNFKNFHWFHVIFYPKIHDFT